MAGRVSGRGAQRELAVRPGSVAGSVVTSASPGGDECKSALAGTCMSGQQAKMARLQKKCSDKDSNLGPTD